MKHLRAQAVEHGEADIGPVFGRIVVDPERALAEGHVDDLDNLVGHAAGLGVVGDDRGERLQHLFAEALVGASFIFRDSRLVSRTPGMREIVSILMLIAFCGGLAFALVEVFDIDPLTAYLATSPGGADSVAIIAASTNDDVGFVMAQQIARFMLVLIVGPALSRFVADRIARNVPNISDKTPA
jgi:Transition state regulatory protein AbrB